MSAARAIAAVVCLVVAAAAAVAALQFPMLIGPVVDGAGILSPNARATLDGKLRDYQTRSGHQLVVATVPSLAGTDIRDYGNQLFRHWALGDMQKNDGALLLIAPNDHKVSIEVGYGAEAELTDAISRIIIENAILPRFKAGDFDGGVQAGVDDIMKALDGLGDAVVKRVREQTQPAISDLLPLIIFFIIVLIIVSRSSRGRRVIFIPGGGYGGGWGGGGWSGGGGGGYSGGGGSSGGGGASGSW
jgi:uncharacterized protein